MTTASINAISNPARGLMVFDSTTNQLMVNTGLATSPNWQSIASAGNWNLGGNYNVNPVTQFVGTNDTRPLRFRVNGIKAGELTAVSGNIFFGLRSGETNMWGFSNIAIGTDALKLNSNRSNLVALGDSALFNNGVGSVIPDDGSFNTAIGSKALYSNTTGNSNTAAGYQSLYSNVNGSGNTATGIQTLNANTSGSYNTATGYYALPFNTIGNYNTANGSQSLASNTTGYYNTASGFQALGLNTTGGANTATGKQALFNNSTGNNNTADGVQSLYANINGLLNTAIGYQSMFNNTEGSSNTAVGNASLFNNTAGYNNTGLGSYTLANTTTGTNNTATGFSALHNNLGNSNTAVGAYALYNNSTASGNVAMGYGSLNQNSSGGSNTALGFQTLYNNSVGGANTAIGYGSLLFTTGSYYNTAVGFEAGRNFNMGYNNTMIGAHADINQHLLYNCVAIGESALCTGNSQVRLGNSSTVSIGGSAGWSTYSDGRFKKNIREDVSGIDFIMKLRPVTYQLDVLGLNRKLNIKKEQDEITNRANAEKEAMIFSGFLAQEVEQAAKEAGYDFSGIDKPKNENDLYSLRYADFVVPLVKAVQEQQKMIIDLKKLNAELERRIVILEKK